MPIGKVKKSPFCMVAFFSVQKPKKWYIITWKRLKSYEQICIQNENPMDRKIFMDLFVGPKMSRYRDIFPVKKGLIIMWIHRYTDNKSYSDISLHPDGHSGAFLFLSKKQTVAEFVTTFSDCQTVIWVQNLFFCPDYFIPG